MRYATSVERTLQVALIGRGRWGANLERTLLSLPGVVLKILGRGEDAPPNVDAVVIATPSPTHAEIALRYIEKGVATFIEKPMATSVGGAEHLRDAARRSGAPVFVGHIYLYNPAFEELVRLVPKLGTVRHVLCEAGGLSVKPGTSLLWEWLPHHLSMTRRILGMPAQRAAAWSPSASSSLVAVSQFLFGNTALVSTVNALLPLKRRHVTVSGDRGSIVFDDAGERKLMVFDDDGRISYPQYDDAAPLTQEIEAFLGLVRSGNQDPGLIEEGLAVVRMIAAAERSVALGGTPVGL